MTEFISADDDRKPRRSRIAPGIWQLDYLMGWIEAVDKDGDVLATAVRSTRSEGASFSGWVVHSGADYSDSIRTKAEAIKQLRLAAIERA